MRFVKSLLLLFVICGSGGRGVTERSPKDIRQRIARLSPLQRQVAWFVSELAEAGAGITEIFDIEEETPVPREARVKSKRGGSRFVSLSEDARLMLETWGGSPPLGARALQRALEKVDLSPKDLRPPGGGVSRELHAIAPKHPISLRSRRTRDFVPPPIVNDYARWLVKTRGLTPHSASLYVRKVEQLVEFADRRTRNVEALTKSEIEQFLAENQHYASSTQAQFRPALLSFFDFITASGGRSDNPAKGVEFAKRVARAPRPRQQLGSKLSKLPQIHAEMVPVVSELMEAGLNLREIFRIDERPPLGPTLRVEGARSTRLVHLSDESRKKLDEWGGHLPRGQRAFQRALEKFDVSPKELADPLRPGLTNLPLALLPADSLHPELERRARPPFLRKEFDTAVLISMRTVEVAVRKAAGYSADEYGVPLMRKAFHPDGGPLRDASLPRAEREATANLFSGAIGYFKNPASHRDDLDWSDPVEVAGVIRLADVLLRIVGRTRTD